MTDGVKRVGAGVSLALALLLPATAAFAAGIQPLSVPADGASPALSGAIWYPCETPPTEMRMGPFTISATRDCPLTRTGLPLVVISHGRTGSFLGHRDTAQALADAGFVVAALSHPGDNAQDSSRSGDLSVFLERPADIRRVVDYLLGTWTSAPAIDANRIGFFGFSRGGYTGLVLAGAVPSFGDGSRPCTGGSAACEAFRQGKPPVQDSRIKAAVIADPLSMFFQKDAFAQVRIPVQLWRSEQGGDGVTPDGVAAVAESMPVKPDFRTVANAQHFSFLPPCPDAILQAAREICTDSPAFDRAAFHKEFNGEVVRFFQRTLR